MEIFRKHKRNHGAPDAGKRKREYRKEVRKKLKETSRIRRRRVFLAVLAGVGALCIVLGCKTLPVYREIKASMYDVLSNMDENTFKRAGNTVIYDANDTPIGSIGNEKYEYVDITDIPDAIQKGYIAREDQRFMSHKGVDFIATGRAVLALVKNHGAITQGGSTITQQVVKNNLLTQEQTYERKILEMFIAFELEKEFPKPKIMEFYCNSNYYGNGCYGVEGASQYYFGKHASQLSLAEGAILVATSNSPNNYNPVADYELSMEKKSEVLDDMLRCGFITQEEHDQAVEERPQVVQKSQNIAHENFMITYALHCAALKVMELDGFGFQYIFDSQDSYETYQENYSAAYQDALNEVRNGGYAIHTSFDTSLQDMLQESVDSRLAGFDEKEEDGTYKMQGAAVCIDNRTGLVTAMVGGREGKGSFNRGYQAERQPGSVIKPLLDYGPALDQGISTPASIYTDRPTNVNGYSPENAGGGYRGDVPVREAIARSINTVALQLFDQTGIDTCLSYLGQLEFSSLCFADSTTATISLGGFTYGTNVADIARGYATVANDGFYTGGTCIRSLANYRDGVIFEYDKTEGKQVYSQDTAFMLTDMLEGSFYESYGTAHSYLDGSQVYAGKTGTTNDNKDAWFAGFSRYYTTAVWMGYDIPEEMDGVYGSTYPAEIWSDFMGKAHQCLEKLDFAIPDTILLEGSSGRIKKPGYTSDVYASRPSGWDYVSGILIEEERENEKKREQDRLAEKAEESLASFEAFQISSVEDALALDGKYQEVLSKIDLLDSASTKTAMKERAAYKYGLLSGEVRTSWSDAEEVARQNEQQRKDEENRIKAQESLEAAAQAAKEEKLQQAEWYLSQLEVRTVYSSYVESLSQNARDAVEACREYSEYAGLASRLDEQLDRIGKLTGHKSGSGQDTSAVDGSIAGGQQPGTGTGEEDPPSETAQIHTSEE